MGTSQRISASHTTQLNSNLHYASLLTISDCWSWPSCRRPRTLWSSSGSCPYPCQADCEHQWQGEGNNKVWVPIPGTCKTNPHDQCRDVTKQKARQVAYPVCRDVPEQQCADVPRQACRQVPDQVCSNQALEQCSKRPVEQCHAVHKKIPVRVSKRVPKKVCDHGYAAPTPVSSNQPEIFDARNNQQATTKNQKIVFA